MLWHKVQAAGGVGGDAGWDISAATFVRSFSVASQDGLPFGLHFKPDGTKMYVVGQSGEDINEYSLSTAWDISSASFVTTFDVSDEESNPTGVFFKPDGTEMYVTGSGNDLFNQYSLGTAWNISTASFTRSATPQVSNPNSIFFSDDGTRLYDVASSNVGQYSLGTAWNLSTLSYVRSFSVSAQETAPQSVFFKPDGTKMYIVGSSGDDVNEYDLGTAWDISTASYLQNFSVASQETFPRGLFFSDDGARMYVVGLIHDSVHQYDVG